MTLLNTSYNFLKQMTDKQRQWLLLGLVMLLAFTLRIWGLDYGLPYIYHVDEHYYVNTALKLGAGILHNPPYAPTGLSNILFGEYAGYYVLGKIFGVFASAQEFEAAFRSDPSAFYMFGRFSSALLGTATCLALFVLGKAVHSPTIGLAAASFLAVSFLHVRESHFGVPDAVLTFFITLSVALAYVAMRTDRRSYLYLAALAAGFAIGMKWSVLPVVLPVGWASLWIGTDSRKNILYRFMSRSVGLAILLSVVGFAISSPQILMNPAPYLNEAMMLARAGRDNGFSIWQIDTLPGWVFYGKVLLIGVGPILAILGLIGSLRRLILMLKTGDKLSILLLLFPLAYYLLMGSTRNYFARYAMPLLPFIALFAAETVAIAVTWVFSNTPRKFGWALAVILTIGAIAQPLIKSIQHDIVLTRQDTRTLAKQWVETHVPADAKIAVDFQTLSPPLSTSENMLPDSSRAYDLTVVGYSGISKHSVAWYREQGYDYLISSSFLYNQTMVSKDWNADRQAFYSSLDEDLNLVQEFWPYESESEPPFSFDEIYGPLTSTSQRERPGPVIRIYKLD